jgi:hypothetical protein
MIETFLFWLLVVFATIVLSPLVIVLAYAILMMAIYAGILLISLVVLILLMLISVIAWPVLTVSEKIQSFVARKRK